MSDKNDSRPEWEKEIHGHLTDILELIDERDFSLVKSKILHSLQLLYYKDKLNQVKDNGL